MAVHVKRIVGAWPFREVGRPEGRRNIRTGEPILAVSAFMGGRILAVRSIAMSESYELGDLIAAAGIGILPPDRFSRGVRSEWRGALRPFACRSFRVH